MRQPIVNDITILSRADVAALMQFGDDVEAIAGAFRQHAEGRAVLPPAMEILQEDGGFHVKSARLGGYVAVKTNSNFPDNRRRGLPTIQGAILLFDAGGVLLALIDSIEIFDGCGLGIQDAAAAGHAYERAQA